MITISKNDSEFGYFKWNLTGRERQIVLISQKDTLEYSKAYTQAMQLCGKGETLSISSENYGITFFRDGEYHYLFGICEASDPALV